MKHLLKVAMCLGLAFSVVACDQMQPKKEDKKMDKHSKKSVVQVEVEQVQTEQEQVQQ